MPYMLLLDPGKNNGAIELFVDPLLHRFFLARAFAFAGCCPLFGDLLYYHIKHLPFLGLSGLHVHFFFNYTICMASVKVSFMNILRPEPAASPACVYKLT